MCCNRCQPRRTTATPCSRQYGSCNREFVHIETLKRELLPRISGAVLQVLPDVGHLSPLEAPKEIAHHFDSFAKELQSKH